MQWKVDHEPDRGIEGPGQQLSHPIDHIRYIRGTNINLLTSRKGKHVLGEDGAALCALHGIVQKTDRAWIIDQPFAQQFEI